jgi:hypothetical protein
MACCVSGGGTAGTEDVRGRADRGGREAIVVYSDDDGEDGWDGVKRRGEEGESRTARMEGGNVRSVRALSARRRKA